MPDQKDPPPRRPGEGMPHKGLPGSIDDKNIGQAVLKMDEGARAAILKGMLESRTRKGGTIETFAIELGTTVQELMGFMSVESSSQPLSSPPPPPRPKSPPPAPPVAPPMRHERPVAPPKVREPASQRDIPVDISRPVWNNDSSALSYFRDKLAEADAQVRAPDLVAIAEELSRRGFRMKDKSAVNANALRFALQAYKKVSSNPVAFLDAKIARLHPGEDTIEQGIEESESLPPTVIEPQTASQPAELSRTPPASFPLPAPRDLYPPPSAFKPPARPPALSRVEQVPSPQPPLEEISHASAQESRPPRWEVDRSAIDWITHNVDAFLSTIPYHAARVRHSITKAEAEALGAHDPEMLSELRGQKLYLQSVLNMPLPDFKQMLGVEDEKHLSALRGHLTEMVKNIERLERALSVPESASRELTDVVARLKERMKSRPDFPQLVGQRSRVYIEPTSPALAQEEVGLQNMNIEHDDSDELWEGRGGPWVTSASAGLFVLAAIQKRVPTYMIVDKLAELHYLSDAGQTLERQGFDKYMQRTYGGVPVFADTAPDYASRLSKTKADTIRAVAEDLAVVWRQKRREAYKSRGEVAVYERAPLTHYYTNFSDKSARWLHDNRRAFYDLLRAHELLPFIVPNTPRENLPAQVLERLRRETAEEEEHTVQEVGTITAPLPTEEAGEEVPENSWTRHRFAWEAILFASQFQDMSLEKLIPVLVAKKYGIPTNSNQVPTYGTVKDYLVTLFGTSSLKNPLLRRFVAALLETPEFREPLSEEELASMRAMVQRVRQGLLPDDPTESTNPPPPLPPPLLPLRSAPPPPPPTGETGEEISENSLTRDQERSARSGLAPTSRVQEERSMESDESEKFYENREFGPWTEDGSAWVLIGECLKEERFQPGMVGAILRDIGFKNATREPITIDRFTEYMVRHYSGFHTNVQLRDRITKEARGLGSRRTAAESEAAQIVARRIRELEQRNALPSRSTETELPPAPVERTLTGLRERSTDAWPFNISGMKRGETKSALEFFRPSGAKDFGPVSAREYVAMYGDPDKPHESRLGWRKTGIQKPDFLPTLEEAQAEVRAQDEKK